MIILRGTLTASLLALAVAGPLALYESMRAPIEPRAVETVASRLATIGPGARARLADGFARADIAYPPARIRLAAFKREGRIDLFAADRIEGGDLRFIKSFDMVAGPRPMEAAYEGPKRREGDRRVPEGLYRLDYLNPMSQAYLSVKIAYPNRFDRTRANETGRADADLGGDIMIHGGGTDGPPIGTEGCLGLADRDMEELFTLVADARGQAERMGTALPADILIAPRDFRLSPLDNAVIEEAGDPLWTARLHRDIDRSLEGLPTAAAAPSEMVKSFRAVLAAD